jgi:hypothetical protein
MALSVMEEPQVGPTVVMLILSACFEGTPLPGAVVGVLVFVAQVVAVVLVLVLVLVVVLVVAVHVDVPR